jgi:hypothetical protein
VEKVRDITTRDGIILSTWKSHDESQSPGTPLPSVCGSTTRNFENFRQVQHKQWSFKSFSCVFSVFMAIPLAFQSM